MVVIRLQRVGRKNDPSFRVVVMEKANAAQSGAFIEIIGHYDPRRKKEEALTVKTDRAQHWLSHGAKPSGTVHNLLVDAGIITGSKVNVTPPKRKKESAEESTSTEAETTTESPDQETGTDKAQTEKPNEEADNAQDDQQETAQEQSAEKPENTTEENSETTKKEE